MTREYLFRGKRVGKHGNWIEGWFCEDEYDKCRICFWDKEGFLEWHEVIPESVGQYTGLKDSTKWEQLTEQEQQKWINEKKGNSEKNWKGKKIFEGDIVEFEDAGEDGYEVKEGYDFQNRGSVFFDNEYGCFSICDLVDLDGYYGNEGFYDNCDGVLSGCFWENTKIIGNVIDNKNLLEGDNK
jgi:hypothetical protein